MSAYQVCFPPLETGSERAFLRQLTQEQGYNGGVTKDDGPREEQLPWLAEVQEIQSRHSPDREWSDHNR